MSSKGGSFLESIHLYRKVPKDLTDATRLGGVLSLFCAVVIAYLFVSNIAEYMTMTTTSDVALDDTGDVHMRLFFNVTMVRRRPCRRRGETACLLLLLPLQATRLRVASDGAPR